MIIVRRLRPSWHQWSGREAAEEARHPEAHAAFVGARARCEQRDRRGQETCRAQSRSFHDCRALHARLPMTAAGDSESHRILDEAQTSTMQRRTESSCNRESLKLWLKIPTRVV